MVSFVYAGLKLKTVSLNHQVLHADEDGFRLLGSNLLFQRETSYVRMFVGKENSRMF